MDAVPVGNHFVSIYPILSGVTTIVEPSTNINGVIIRTGYIAPSNGAVDVYCGRVAPAVVGDRAVPIIFSGNGNSASGSHSEVVLPYPLFVPAGKGLWLGTSVPATTPRPAGIALTWDLLA